MLHLGIILPKDYRLLSVAAILDVFEAVNRIHIEKNAGAFYRITIFGTEVGAETSFHGYPMESIYADVKPDLILIPSFATPDMQLTLQRNGPFIPWLIRQYQGGAEVASFCTGAFLLGASKLLDGKVATTHVDAVRAFANAFPNITLRVDKTVTEDQKIYTSGGSTSSFHLLLHLVQKHCGKEVAVRISKIFAIDMDRHSQSYFSTFTPSRSHNDELVALVQEKIETNFHLIENLEEIIKDIPSSRRNLLRRFKSVTGIAPIEYLQQVRIEASKKMLEQSNRQMSDVINHTGYNDPKAFRKVFRKIVGMTPSDYREKFQIR
ncbi:helix-turn-helix domain-containing protein [Sediminibacterium roseum]|uniref:Helix-turn-helix domain-containing protein n=1 Tax=Sediminibacterium roseum TaxID=1978412 RepID=A0ABW9ZSD4_9BACT|nr:helix-turn-helix domain-containing protein [Sediminibacterium roseum]NCI50021.1 helix-turn-helix domain-containing protein [Sediminibacterium roseum]